MLTLLKHPYLTRPKSIEHTKMSANLKATKIGTYRSGCCKAVFSLDHCNCLVTGIGLSGVKFTNILRAAFSNKSFCAAFMFLQFRFVIFWQKDFGAKAAHKMLVKLTPGFHLHKYGNRCWTDSRLLKHPQTSMGEIVELSQKWPRVVRSGMRSQLLWDERDFENLIYTSFFWTSLRFVNLD